jgi:hypothetical protein
MIRKTYTVSSWDKEAGLGYATDGTSWEGSPILFPIYAKDVEDYEGYLEPGELITAVERISYYTNPELYLTDIITESGPRCANFSSALSIVMTPPDEPVTREQYLELIARIEDLESRVYCDDSE